MGGVFSSKKETEESPSCRLFLDQPATSLTTQASVQPIFSVDLHDYDYSAAKLNLMCVTSDSKLLFVASKENVLVFALSSTKPFVERILTIKLRSTINQIRCVENQPATSSEVPREERRGQHPLLSHSSGITGPTLTASLSPSTSTNISSSASSMSSSSFSSPSFMASSSFSDSFANQSLICVTDGGDVVVFHLDTSIRKAPVVSSALYRCPESSWCGTIRNNQIFVSANSCEIHVWPVDAIEGEQGQTIERAVQQSSGSLSGHVHNIPCFDINAAGTRLVSCSIDHSIKIWDLGNKDCIRSANPIDDRGWCCKYIPASSVHTDQLNYDNKAELISAIRGGTEELILYGSVEDLFVLSPALSVLAHLPEPFAYPEDQESDNEPLDSEDSCCCCLVEYLRSFNAISGLAFLDYIPELSLVIVASPRRHRISFIKLFRERVTDRSNGSVLRYNMKVVKQVKSPLHQKKGPFVLGFSLVKEYRSEYALYVLYRDTNIIKYLIKPKEKDPRLSPPLNPTAASPLPSYQWATGQI